jgi:hypothetical protein
VFSTLFLVVSAALLWWGRLGTAVVTVVVAFGIALNGLSIYAWDRLRERFEAAVGGAAPDRALTPYRLSPEMKAELLAGATMIGTLCVGFVAATALPRLVGVRGALWLSMLLLGLGNLAGLALASRRGSRS